MEETAKPAEAQAGEVKPAITVKGGELIYFEGVATFGIAQGVASMMLVAQTILPTEGGGVEYQWVGVAHLRCTKPALMDLRNTIDKIMLLEAPTEGAKN